MRAVSQKFIDEFLKQADCALLEGRIVQFIVAGYEKERDRFHDIFLQSRFMLKMDGQDIQIIFGKLRGCLSEKTWNDLVCLGWLKHFISRCDEKIEHLINENNISAQDLLYYYEKLAVKYKTEGKFFDDVPSHIADSQFAFYETVFGCLIDIITRYAIPFKDTAPKEKPGLKQIMAVILQKESATDIFNGISYKFYNPNYAKNCWVLEHTCNYWTEFELYRDLNFKYYCQHDTTLCDSINLFESSGFLRRECNNEVFRFDFAKAERYFAELETFKTNQMLSFLYGSADTEFEYQGDIFKIRDLMEMVKALSEYAGRQDEVYFGDKRPAVLKTVGSRQLLRMVGLPPTSGRKKLLELFCFNLEEDRGYQSWNKLLFRRGELIYLLRSRIQAPTLIKVIDKILANEVVVRYPEKRSRGIFFEEHIEKFFRDNAIPFWRIPRKAVKMIPEIDGIFLIDNIVFVYEAKASIKPENFVEAFCFLKDSLLKAEEQIRERTHMLENDAVRRRFIEKQTGLSFEGKIIQPLIICNHMFFSGFKGLTIDENRHIPIIDFILLKKIIAERKAPAWKLSKHTGRYRKSDQELVSGDDIRNYLLNQILIQGDIRIQHQLTQYGVIFPICPPSEIDEDNLIEDSNQPDLPL
ncbi:hypothetical protein [Propionispora sp. 2/2-37]|uniref:hypothetical protein n=1 Tax=Propionispora sp. 2/2-37 TaxID=1677858 RepID=UPI0006BB670A|nr:hypothetical protein [Propionispora sp. 2/2-37]